MSEQDPTTVALDALEKRIRSQAEAAEPMSMVWRAHMADLMHLEAVRREFTGGGRRVSEVGLTEAERELLDEALWGGRIYDDVPAVVEGIVAARNEGAGA